MYYVPLRPPDPRVMVYSQDGGHKLDSDQEFDQWVLICFAEIFILVRDLDRGPEPIDSRCASIVSGPSLMQYE